jgi:hypothetical protein
LPLPSPPLPAEDPTVSETLSKRRTLEPSSPTFATEELVSAAIEIA